MTIELTQAAKDLLAARGFDPVLGARPLRRTVQREIEDTLAEKMLYGEVGPGQIVQVDVEGEGPTATFTFEGKQRTTIPARGPARRWSPSTRSRRPTPTDLGDIDRSTAPVTPCGVAGACRFSQVVSGRRAG